MIVKRHSRQSIPCPTNPLPHCPPSLASANSFPHNSLSDHHPLSPVLSILYKKGGGPTVLASHLILPSTARCPSSRFRLRELCALGDLCVNSVSFFQRSTFDCQLSSSPSPNSFTASPLESAREKPVKKTHLSTFRMNTSKSASKQRTLSAFRMNTYEKQGRGWPVIVN